MNIETFPLAWRWTQPSHAVLPSDVLKTLMPLSDAESDRLYARGEDAFRQRMDITAVHRADEDCESTRLWLMKLGIAPGEQVSVVWDRKTAISLPWEAFVAYWDDFCYPSSDDVFVFPENSQRLLAWRHDAVFEFVDDARQEKSESRP